MKLIESLTPDNTEEIKPGLFIQKTKRGYRSIKPLAWNGEWLIKEQLKTVFNLRTIFTIALILFIAWTYFNETQFCRELRSDPCVLLPNITEYCYSNDNYGKETGGEIQWNTIAVQGDT